MQCRSHSRRLTSESLFVTACSMDEYAEEKRTEKNLIVRSGISEAETTNNKILRSTFCIEAIQTRSIARPLCDSRATCLIQWSAACLLVAWGVNNRRAATEAANLAVHPFTECKQNLVLLFVKFMLVYLFTDSSNTDHSVAHKQRQSFLI